MSIPRAHTKCLQAGTYSFRIGTRLLIDGVIVLARLQLEVGTVLVVEMWLEIAGVLFTV